MNKKNIKALALASIFSLSLASGKFNQNKVCAAADIVYEIFRIVGYGGLGFIGGMAFQKFLDSRNQLVNNDINHDNNTDSSSTNNKQTRVSSIPFMKFLSNNNKQTMAFPNIPLLKWQDGNCFFLAALYTLYAPENIHKYRRVSAMTIQQAARAYVGYARNFGGVDLRNFGFNGNIIHTHPDAVNNIVETLMLNGKFQLMINGVIELCKLFVRMHDDNKPGQEFQIIPEDIKGVCNERGFEQLICGSKLLDRGTLAGNVTEVFTKFVMNNNPLVRAIVNDRSYYAMYAPNQPEEIKDISQIQFLLQGRNEGLYSMDENGKITVNGEEYYLAAFYRCQGTNEGHIVCRQPKYKQDKDGSIKLDGVLKLSCLDMLHTYEKKSTMFDVLNEFGLKANYGVGMNNQVQINGGVNFGFRFVPKKEMLKHKEFYFNN